MIGVEEAKQHLLEKFMPQEPETLPLVEVHGRILAEDIFAQVDLPPFPNSAMDGFAVQEGDVQQATPEQPVTLDVIGDIPAGSTFDGRLGAGQALRIMTGAPIPVGADLVIPVEDTDFNVRSPGYALPERVKILHTAPLGANIRPRGQDLHRGELALEKGRRLLAREIGFLSMLGVAEAPVFRRPRVAIFSSGDELLTVEQPLSPGKIYDANLAMLSCQVKQAGGQPINLGIAADQEAAILGLLERAASSQVDLIVSSAGVSVGAFDYVRSVVETQGSLDFWRVNMRPGKPLAFGSFRDIPMFGLPGNPVSAFIGFEVFIRPAILKMTGASQERRRQRVHLGEAVELDGRETYLRAIIDPTANNLAHLSGHQGSGNLRALVGANALLIIPSGVKSLPAGAELDAWLLDD